MKKYLREAEYGLSCKIGPANDIVKAKEVVRRLREMGLDSSIEDGNVIIDVERDPFDDHYVDDMTKIAKKEYMKIMKSGESRSYRMAESKLKKIIKETVQKALLESNTVDTSYVDNEREWAKLVNSEKKFIEELVAFLNRNGIKSARVGSQPSGWPCVSMASDEHRSSNARRIAEAFGERRGKTMRVHSYPATTHYCFH